MSQELKPCPFCGCKVAFKSNRDWDRIVGDHLGWCLLGSQEFMAPAGQAELLAHDWNRRSLPAPREEGAGVWQPMETAPRDGTQVELHHKPKCEYEGEVKIGWFVQGFWLANGEFWKPEEMKAWRTIRPIPATPTSAPEQEGK